MCFLVNCGTSPWPMGCMLATDWMSETYWIMGAVRDVGINASISLELHVAAGVAALYWRYRRTMRLLSRSVWLCWFLAVAATALLAFSHEHCVRNVVTQTHIPCAKVETDIIFGASCVTCFLYFLSAFRAMCYPGTQERRADTMVCLYLVAFGVTDLRFNSSTWHTTTIFREHSSSLARHCCATMAS